MGSSPGRSASRSASCTGPALCWSVAPTPRSIARGGASLEASVEASPRVPRDTPLDTTGGETRVCTGGSGAAGPGGGGGADGDASARASEEIVTVSRATGGDGGADARCDTEGVPSMPPIPDTRGVDAPRLEPAMVSTKDIPVPSFDGVGCERAPQGPKVGHLSPPRARR